MDCVARAGERQWPPKHAGECGERAPVERAGRMTKALLAMSVVAAALLGTAAVGAQPRIGHLEVRSEPPAEIVIDGRPTGLWTPQTLALDAGHHAVTLVRRERRPSTFGIRVEPGRTTRLNIHLAF
jgi:PEGA domain